MKVLYVCSTEQLYGDNKALLNLLPNLERLGVKPLFLVKGRFQFYSYLNPHCSYPLCNSLISNIRIF